MPSDERDRDEDRDQDQEIDELKHSESDVDHVDFHEIDRDIDNFMRPPMIENGTFYNSTAVTSTMTPTTQMANAPFLSTLTATKVDSTRI